jgi:short-subunit dehydrogenase involved in D-alanine esterification of teichoic acids
MSTTELLTLMTAVVVLITAVATWRINQLAKAVQEVHVIVNSRMTAVLARVEQLTEALETSDTDVPVDPEERKTHER